MPNFQKISIALTGEQIAALKAAVTTGAYATTSEIVPKALRDWHFKRELRGEDIKRLRELWAQGKASGPATELNLAEVRQQARQRLTQAHAGLSSAGAKSSHCKSIEPAGNLAHTIY